MKNITNDQDRCSSAVSQLRNEIRKKTALQATTEKRLVAVPNGPIDDVYHRGVAWLNSL